jgi:hypothetical protein
MIVKLRESDFPFTLPSRTLLLSNVSPFQSESLLYFEISLHLITLCRDFNWYVLKLSFAAQACGVVCFYFGTKSIPFPSTRSLVKGFGSTVRCLLQLPLFKYLSGCVSSELQREVPCQLYIGKIVRRLIKIKASTIKL